MTHRNRSHSHDLFTRLAFTATFAVLLLSTHCTLAAAVVAPRVDAQHLDDAPFKWVHGHPGSASRPLNPPELRPIVIWHGMGDAAHSEGMAHVRNRLLAALPDGAFVHMVQVGKDDNDDRKRSYLDDLPRQIQQVCQQLQSVPQLAPRGFHAIGFSQGGLFLRAIAQQCPQVRMKRLITWASPHQGIADVPPTWCTNQPLWCGLARLALRRGAYAPAVQHRVVQAGYVKTPWNLEAYRRGNLFLPDINNENNINPLYADQIRGLEKLVLVKHADDTVLNPPESSWFSEMVDEKQLVPVFNSTLYKDDLIGLKSVDQRGDLVMVQVPGDHMQFSVDSFLNLTLPFLAPRGPPSATPMPDSASGWYAVGRSTNEQRPLGLAQ